MVLERFNDECQIPTAHLVFKQRAFTRVRVLYMINYRVHVYKITQ